MSTVAAIVGSAFDETLARALDLAPERVATPRGEHAVLRARAIEGRSAFVLYRHGLPHRLLPNQIDYRAQAWALHALGCDALLVTSAVGLLDPELPRDRPLLVGDVVTLDNRLPDGSACTVFDRPQPGQGHLVLGGGLIDRALARQVRALADAAGAPVAPGEVVFGYAGGPRTKTAAENRMWRTLGAHCNSMSLAPEVILANELQIPTVALVAGHKRSAGEGGGPGGAAEVAASLRGARDALAPVVEAFLRGAEPVAFANHLFRFDAGADAPAADAAAEDGA